MPPFQLDSGFCVKFMSNLGISPEYSAHPIVLGLGLGLLLGLGLGTGLGLWLGIMHYPNSKVRVRVVHRV